MGNKGQVKVKCWENFLSSIGCNLDRVRSSHHIWKCPNCKRSITFWGNHKEIPPFHIHTNLKTLGISKSFFFDWIEKNC